MLIYMFGGSVGQSKREGEASLSDGLIERFVFSLVASRATDDQSRPSRLKSIPCSLSLLLRPSKLAFSLFFISM